MAVTSGFFNSISGDRLYNADQMSLYFEGLISQGVFENVGNRLHVTASTGMAVSVGTGRAIVQSKWIKNDSELSLSIGASDVQKNRIDAIALRYSATAREVSIVVKAGTPATGTASPPTRATGADVYELYLAYVSVPKATTAITQDLITDLRPSAQCGWITGIIDQVDTSDLFAQWQAAYQAFYTQTTAAFDAYFAQKRAEYEAWFRDLTSELRVDTSLKRYQNSVTVTGTTSEIPVGIADYDSGADILFAFVGGVYLVEGDDFTISGTGAGAKINLVRAFTGTNDVTFFVIKSVIGEGWNGSAPQNAELTGEDTPDSTIGQATAEEV